MSYTFKPEVIERRRAKLPPESEYPPHKLEARRMWIDGGYDLVEIGKHFGKAKSTIEQWIKDPHQELSNARKAQYRVPCRGGCGGTTNPNGPAPSRTGYCAACLPDKQRQDRRKRVVDAIRRWVDEHGEIPAATDWSPALAIQLGQPEAARRSRGGGWPYTTTAVEAFGSWNAAIAAAGFEPRRVGTHRRDGTAEDHARAKELYDELGSYAAVAEAMGRSVLTITHWINDTKQKPKGKKYMAAPIDPIEIMAREITKHEEKIARLEPQIEEAQTAIAKLKRAQAILSDEPAIKAA